LKDFRNDELNLNRQSSIISRKSDGIVFARRESDEAISALSN